MNLVFQKPLEFDFEGLRPEGAGTGAEGIRGKALWQGGKDWKFELHAEADRVALSDFQWVNPENLGGASGDLQGEITFKTDAHENTGFEVHLRVPEPGGNIPSKFFDLLLPYLPQLKNQEKIQEIRAIHRLLAYRNADLEIKLLASDKMKIAFHILIPDYNVDLHLKVDVRLDEKNAFRQLAQLAGLMQVTTS